MSAKRRQMVGCEDADGSLIVHRETDTCPVCAPEARAEAGQTAVGNLTANPDAVSQKADSEPAVDLLRATVNRLMGERDALAHRLTELADEVDYQLWSAFISPDRLREEMERARAALAQLDSVAPPLTPND